MSLRAFLRCPANESGGRCKAIFQTRQSNLELVDEDGNQYEISGMIYRSGDMDEPQGPGEKYEEGKCRTNSARSDAHDTYKLVYDVPSSAKGLKLWFQDFPLIDFGLELP